MSVTAVFARLEDVLGDLPRAGVVHVGAHKGQEVPHYRRAGFDRIVCVEPNPKRARQLRRLGVTVHQCAVSATPGPATLHLTRFDEQSSLLTPTKIQATGTIKVPCRPLAELQAGCNVAVVDVQGSELDVLRSADLVSLDLVIVETCGTIRYEGAASREAIHEFWAAAGWRHVGAWPHRTPVLTDEVWAR